MKFLKTNFLNRFQIIATKRDDLTFPDERKISGTAARIARNRAYHHLTLLIDEDLTVLRKSLQSPIKVWAFLLFCFISSFPGFD